MTGVLVDADEQQLPGAGDQDERALTDPGQVEQRARKQQRCHEPADDGKARTAAETRRSEQLLEEA